ncbi:MAG: Penicillin-binding protein A [Firmicutes bacterium ADurb.Bin506]|jgi:peptidoglycan glycosyltransferase|nr:MAG: Penicillin-binding protein A [Firmicutes bacterium ADurb.Bin506]
MSPRVLRLIAAWVAGCALLALATTYHMVVRGDALSSDSVNPRVTRARAEVERGSFLTSDGWVIASSDSPGASRAWRGPDSLSQIVGYVSPTLGVSGLESVCDGWLSGVRYDFQRTGVLGTLSGRPERGFDVELTIDSRVQLACERALAGRRGAAVVIDAFSGEILAAASSPWVTPDLVELAPDYVMAREDAPLLPRALSGLYPPGSCIKPLVAAAALDGRWIEPDDEWHCDGWIRAGGTGISDVEGGHGTLSLEQALAVSCNTYFAHIAMATGSDLRHRLTAMGLDSYLDVQSPSASASLGASESWATPEGLAQMAIGQGDMVVTPLHMAVVYAAIANGGTMWRPSLVRRVVDADGNTVKSWRPVSTGKAMRPASAAAIETGLRAAANWGTASAANISGAEVFGKTGTAENAAGAPHAWFCGYVRSPRGSAAVSIIIENGGSGGAVAAPLAGEIIKVVSAFYEGR